MSYNEQWLQWAVELQSLAQAGLYYGRDVYDHERYQRIRDIAAEMVASKADLSLEKIKDLFCCEVGYQTPKLDTRAAVFQGDAILLVREGSGLWALPGGWADVGLSPAENAVKEVLEEAGLHVTADQVIAVQDWSRHNHRNHAFEIYKIFFLCSSIGGGFKPNSETSASGYFPRDGYPPLSEDKTTAAQLQMCFDAYHAPHWATLFD